MPHTPTPYQIGEQKCDGVTYYELQDAAGRSIADTCNNDLVEIHEEFDEGVRVQWDEQGRKNMEFLALAANSHAALVAACEEAVDRLGRWGEDSKQLQAALALARKEK